MASLSRYQCLCHASYSILIYAYKIVMSTMFYLGLYYEVFIIENKVRIYIFWYF